MLEASQNVIKISRNDWIYRRHL